MQVYLITNKITGKVYIGQTIHAVSYRWSQHRSAARRRSSTSHFYNAIRKYGEACWTVEVLAECGSREALNLAEELAIWLYRAMDRTRGYNGSSGGESPHLTEESLRKMAESSRGRRCPEVVESNRRRRGIPCHSVESRQQRRNKMLALWASGRFSVRPKTRATCHPEKFVKGHGLCSSCWQNQRYRRRSYGISNSQS